ncbi:MAG: hypothetical protein AAF787_00245 [Chloroflexota bacterium]
MNPVLNSNDVFLSLGGTDISAYFTAETSREVSINMVDVTHGSGVEWSLMRPGLKSYSMSLTLAYKVNLYQTDIEPVLTSIMANDTQATLIYGPEGQASGKPRDEVDVFIESMTGPTLTIEKDMVVIELSLVAAGEPVAYIGGGGVFA